MVSVVAILFAVTLLGLVDAQSTCRKFECTDLDGDVCAIVYDNTVSINKDDCDDGYECFVFAIRATLAQQELPNGYNIACAKPDDSEDTSETQSIDCAIDENKRLASGSYPKSCTANTDCQLKDGTYGTCTCSMDGTYYCKPHISDPDMFPWITTYCKDGKITGKHVQYYVDLTAEIAVDLDKVECWDNLDDAKYWKNLEDGEDDLAYMLALVGILAYVF